MQIYIHAETLWKRSGEEIQVWKPSFNYKKKFLDWSAFPHKEVEYVKVSFLKTMHNTYLSGNTKSLDNMDFSFRVFF